MNDTVNTVDATEVAPFTITDVTVIDGNDRDGETSRQEIEGTIFVAEDSESQPVSYDA